MNNQENKFTQSFTDEQGGKSTVVIEGRPNKAPNFSKDKYKLVENIKTNSNHYLTKKSKNIFTADIGVHSPGFAPIITLSTIIALFTVVILYIIFKY